MTTGDGLAVFGVWMLPVACVLSPRSTDLAMWLSGFIAAVVTCGVIR